MADRQAAAPGRARQADVAAQPAEVAEQREHALAVHAGVAELEALVDEREVGQQVAGRGVRHGGPIRVRARAQAQPRDRPCSTRRRCRSSRRAGSRRVRRRARAAPPARGRAGSTGPSSASSSSSSDCHSSSARCSRRAATSPAGRSGVTAAKPRRAAAQRPRVLGDAGGASRGARRAEPRNVIGGQHADAAEAVLERALKSARASAARACAPMRRSSLARAPRLARRRAPACCAPTATVPRRKRWPPTRALSSRAWSVSAAKRWLPAAKPTPAQTAAMSLRWLHVRSSSSSRSSRAVERWPGRDAERVLARAA